jgi:hypothetical protein
MHPDRGHWEGCIVYSLKAKIKGHELRGDHDFGDRECVGVDD